MRTEGDLKFSSTEFLKTEGPGRRLIHVKAAGIFFSQGTESDFVLYLLAGRAKLTVVSKSGKEATITLLAVGDFIGEEAVAGDADLRTATASAITPCTAMKISGEEMVRVLHDEKSNCAQCMRAFRQNIDQVSTEIRSADCRYCGGRVRYAIAFAVKPMSAFTMSGTPLLGPSRSAIAVSSRASL